MKTINKIDKLLNRIGQIACVALICMLGSSCSDDEATQASYFTIEGNPTGLNVEASGISSDLTKAKQYVIRSNKPWKIIAQSDDEWVRIFPMEGNADGIIRISVTENPTFNKRTQSFAFQVDGEQQPVLFQVSQEANVPYITIDGAEDGQEILAAGGEFEIPVAANVEWTYSIGAVNWLHEVSVSENTIKLSADHNVGTEQRKATITVKSTVYPDVYQTIELTQVTAGVLLNESFEWLTYGSTVQYTTTGETAITKWTSDELAHGWTSLSGWCYARPGFVKLGKTNYGGDIISPAFSQLTGKSNVTVTFKATAYISSGGTKDDTVLYIGVIGGGSIEDANASVTVQGNTYSVKEFAITNYPNSSKNENGDGYSAWEESLSLRNVKIKDATSTTKVIFLGGAFDNGLASVGSGKNRIFLDDIKAVVSE